MISQNKPKCEIPGATEDDIYITSNNGISLFTLDHFTP